MADALQLPGWPLGLSRQLAAAYIGVPPSMFDEMVIDGRMPEGKRFKRRKVWDRQAIDGAFSILGENGLKAPPPRRFGDRLR